MRNVIEHCLVIGMGIVLFVHMTLIAVYGRVIIEERNEVILWAELVGFTLIIIFGLVRFVRELIRLWSDRH